MLTSLSIKLTNTMRCSADENAIMIVRGVSDYLKLAKHIFYRTTRAEQILAFKVRGSWHFSKEDIEAWIRDQNVFINAN